MMECPREGCEGSLETLRSGDREIPLVRCPLAPPGRLYLMRPTGEGCPLMGVTDDD